MKKYLTIVLFFSSFSLLGQHKVFVKGKITNAIEKGIENVHVKIQQQNMITKSNEKGFFTFFLFKKESVTLVFSHVSYKTQYKTIKLLADTIVLNVELSKKTEQLPEITIYDKNEPIPVFRSTKISIADYEFKDNNFIFLVYEKRLNKNSELYLVDENEKVIAKHFIPGKPVELVTDYLGNTNLICENYVYRINVIANKLSLIQLSLTNFKRFIKPIVDTLEKNILFSDFLHQFPRFKYYAFDTSDTLTNLKVIKEVVNKTMDWQYNFEYYDLTNTEKQFAKRMAQKLKGYSKFDIAASMTGFANNFLYEEVYAPLFVINDTINIFDHYENKIWKFIDDTIEVGSVPINYHHPQKESEWKKQLIMDEVNGKIYAVFLKNGYYYLKEININSGKIVNEKKLSFQFVSKIKIKDGFVYYTYKLKQTLQKKFLYKESLN